MDWLTNLIWHDGKFLGVEWSIWKVIGWIGNAVFFSRFVVQWYATEKSKRVVVPTAFWWLSLTGSLLLLIYSVLEAGFRFHLRLRFHMDSLRPQSHHPSPARGRAHGLHWLRTKNSPAVEFLSELRREGVVRKFTFWSSRRIAV